MRNPFPGMNPWLELDWPEAHARLVVYSCDALQDQMPPGMRVRVEQSVTIDSEEDRGWMRPDVHVYEAWDGGGGGTTLAVETEATPGLLTIEDPPPERHLEIVDAHGVIVTAIEFLSPTNKIAGDGLETYRSKQRAYLSARVNLVEIDLVRRGSFALAMPQSSFPVQPLPPYKACVFRGERPRQRESFPIGLRHRLPRLPIPLRPTDREAVLDLQPLIDRCCTNGAYGPTDYARPLDPPLSEAAAAWATTRLREAGLLLED